MRLRLQSVVQGKAARAGNRRTRQRRSPHGPAIVDLQEFNKSLRLGDILADPFAWTHPETVLKVLQILIGHLQRVFDPFQDLLPRGSSIAIGAFQFIDLRLEAASPLSAQLPSRSPGERQKAFGAWVP